MKIEREVEVDATIPCAVTKATMARIRRAVEHALEEHAREAEEQEDPDIDFRSFVEDAMQREGFSNVGVNADWSVVAFHLSGGTPNIDSGETYLLSEEGTWVLARRFHVDDGYRGIPSSIRDQADGVNDVIAECRVMDNDELIEWATGDKPTTRHNPQQWAPTSVQTLIFDASLFNAKSAKSWAKAHGFSYGKVDRKENTIRFRQDDPEKYDRETFRTKRLTDGVSAVVGVKERP